MRISPVMKMGLRRRGEGIAVLWATASVLAVAAGCTVAPGEPGTGGEGLKANTGGGNPGTGGSNTGGSNAGGGDTGGNNSGGAGVGGGEDARIGQSCASSADCPDGVCLSSEEFPEGYCAKDCSGAVLTEGEPCPPGAACIRVTDAASICLDLCDSSADCREGYACATYPSGEKVCVPACTSDTNCGPKEVCNTSTGLCDPAPEKKVAAGEACAADADCVGDFCITPDTFYPGGYCSGSCAEADYGKPCAGGNGTCFAVDDGSGPQFVCLEECTTSASCRKGYVCTSDGGETTDSGLGACVPSCANENYCADYTCDASGVCIPATVETPYTTATLSLGNLALGPNASDIKAVSFDVADDVVSFTVVASNPDEAGVAAARVTAPTGEVLFDTFSPSKTLFRTIPGTTAPFAALYPNTPRLTVVPGKYTFELWSEFPTNAKVDVVFKKGVGAVAGGDLPLVLWFAPQDYLNAATAKTDVRFQKSLQRLKEIYTNAGITVTWDDSSYIDLDDPALGVIEERAELWTLFANADGSTKPGLNLFFIDQYAFGGGGILGISGGIPGTPSFPGISHAGVSCALSWLYSGDEAAAVKDFAETMAHEGGHYLGLFHTSEAKGTTFDPIDDTPECPASKHDTNGDGRVDGNECASAGAPNLMFWASTGKPQDEITPQQQFVLQRNPSVTH